MTDQPPIAAIQTRYAGCHFRSRLEARWAVFFDALNIRWEYEPQGYDLGQLLNRVGEIPRWWDEPPIGGWYLPDFYLPDLASFYEVKGTQPHGKELARLRTFGLAVGRGLVAPATRFFVQVGGIPRTDLGPGAVYSNWIMDEGPEPPARIQLHSNDGSPWECWWTRCPRCEGIDLTLLGGVDCSCWPDSYFGDDDPVILAAYAAARSARFEFGETPNEARP